MSYDLLDGVRVVELSLFALAPSAAAVLCDWGADVIKVVPAKVADPMMGNPIAGLPKKDVGVAFMWEILNRGKRCVGVDVSTPDGRQILIDLVAQADVFLTNLLPGSRSRLRIDPVDLFLVNPRLIYGRASGHGPDGPERDDGGYDHTDFWARTGIAHAASMVSDEFVPQPGPAMGDLSAGAFLAGSIAAALYRREMTGRGALVDVSLLSSGLWVGAPAVVATTCRTPSSPRTKPVMTGRSIWPESSPKVTSTTSARPSTARTCSKIRVSPPEPTGSRILVNASACWTNSSRRGTSPTG
jgi:crotonobetainyl-CoA:carnitine CoA-transferase CaiB-like acyl-CoA transferase